MVIFGVAHRLVSKFLDFIVPPHMNGVLSFTESVTFVMFLLLYLFLGWEMLMIFFGPVLMRRQPQSESIAANRPTEPEVER
jgi:hypothetical protein